MSDAPTYGFDTLQIHAGSRPDPATGARQTPIYQTTAYVFRDTDHAAALFNLQEVGYIYSRLTNPTVAVLQERLAALEGGAGAVCCSSGHGAQIMALFPIMQPGCNIITSDRLYGGTVTPSSAARSIGSDGPQSSLTRKIWTRCKRRSTKTPAPCSASPSPIRAGI